MNDESNHIDPSSAPAEGAHALPPNDVPPADVISGAQPGGPASETPDATSGPEIEAAESASRLKDGQDVVFNSLKARFNETSAKSITFVPSRGPKLPWQ